MRRAALWVSLLLVGCGEPAPIQAPVATTPEPPPVASAAPEPTPPEASPDPELDRQMAELLGVISKARRLSPKSPVTGQRLARAEVTKLIMTKTDKELPKGVLEAQGELLRGMGLIQRDYDFVGGIYGLIEENLAGFYDQHEDKMFILDDLPEAAIEETLVHELVHALQDQHFDLTAMLDYQPGDSDRVTAGHALAEGDAMSAMFDVTLGDARKITAQQLRVAMVASVAFSASGHKTPRLLQASLIAPYIDGFRFVQGLRARGGWTAVDAAYKSLPVSTEQLLHIDKYEAKEAPIKLPVPSLPPGFEVRDQDVLGEQGLRMVFEQWSANSLAAEAAAGWGGDRFVVGAKPGAGGTVWASAWVIRFDDAGQAQEAVALMRTKFPKTCVERTELGPFGWHHKGTDLAIVAGPFEKSKTGATSSKASCAASKKWLARLL